VMRPHVRGDDGFVALELALGVAVLLLPVGALVLVIPTWSERQTTARAIAREVGRTVARDGTCRPEVASGVAGTMSANLGLPRPDVAVSIDCDPGTALVPGADLEVTVTVRMPAVELPGLGPVGEWSWSALHRQPVDRYGSAP
jgi:hypothetical protein